MRSHKANQQSKLIFQIILAPIKILSKARYFYMKSMQDCAGKLGYSTVAFGGAAVSTQSVYLPKSFSVSSTQSNSTHNEQFKELLKRSIIQSSNMHIEQRDQVRLNTMVSCDKGRSYGVGLGKIGRIDEDRPCSFKEADNMDANLYLRSRTHALRRNIVYL